MGKHARRRSGREACAKAERDGDKEEAGAVALPHAVERSFVRSPTVLRPTEHARRDVVLVTKLRDGRSRRNEVTMFNKFLGASALAIALALGTSGVPAQQQQQQPAQQAKKADK